MGQWYITTSSPRTLLCPLHGKCYIIVVMYWHPTPGDTTLTDTPRKVLQISLYSWDHINVLKILRKTCWFRPISFSSLFPTDASGKRSNYGWRHTPLSHLLPWSCCSGTSELRRCMKPVINLSYFGNLPNPLIKSLIKWGHHHPILWKQMPWLT